MLGLVQAAVDACKLTRATLDMGSFALQHVPLVCLPTVETFFFLGIQVALPRKPTQLVGSHAFILKALQYLSAHPVLQDSERV